MHTALSGLSLHHVGIVVRDLDVAADSYRVLGFRDDERFVMPELGIEAVTFPSGIGYVELIQPTDPEGAIARFMEKRGDSLHHVAFGTPDIVAELRRLENSGVRLIDTSPRTGAHGWQIAFIHPESCNGVLVELVQVV
ncbi:methylmalonyl-CoA epimerase [soil metagenome]